MKRCKECGSYAVNQHCHGREAGVDLNLCDVCYWRKRAAQAPELLGLLCEALPFVEDAEDDPGFKPGFVKKKVARIRALIERIEEPK